MFMDKVMLRFVYTVLLTVLMAHHARAQDTDTLDYSFNLPETVVLADGMTFEEYLLKQVLANAKPLKERIETLDCTTNSRRCDLAYSCPVTDMQGSIWTEPNGPRATFP